MTFLLDTDHVSILQRESGAEHTALYRRIAAEGQANLAFSVITFHEQVLGCHAYINRAHGMVDLIRGYALMSRLIRDFTLVPVLPFDADAALVFEDLQSQRLRVATMDLRIAAIALSRDLTLLTRNVSDFGKAPNLRTEDWTR